MATTKEPPQSEQLIDIPEAQVTKTELSYVSAINRPTYTFFVQLCKFSKEELNALNEAINKHCHQIQIQREAGDSTKALPTKVRTGRIYCVLYTEDKCWYRARALTVDKVKKTCSVAYVDYGNLDTVSWSDIIEVKKGEVEEMEHLPFGIFCFFKEFENYDETKKQHALDCLQGVHVMIKMLERQTSLQWMVDIPKHAYNMIFWRAFEPDDKHLTDSVGTGTSGSEIEEHS